MPKGVVKTTVIKKKKHLHIFFNVTNFRVFHKHIPYFVTYLHIKPISRTYVKALRLP